jgi:AcrR family transcriptional regulator
MQILKTEIHRLILENAETLFYSLGFEATSTRELAKKVGVSYSNLYRYFKNKNDLYDAIMQPYYVHFTQTLTTFLTHDEDDPGESHHIETITQVFMSLIKTDRKKFIILMEGSQGTCYEALRCQVIGTIAKRIRLSLPQAVAENSLMINVIAVNFFNGLLELTKKSVGDDMLQKNMEILVVYHLSGISKLVEF